MLFIGLVPLSEIYFISLYPALHSPNKDMSNRSNWWQAEIFAFPTCFRILLCIYNIHFISTFTTDQPWPSLDEGFTNTDTRWRHNFVCVVGILHCRGRQSKMIVYLPIQLGTKTGHVKRKARQILYDSTHPLNDAFQKRPSG